jgi:hypothetical protein
VQSFVATLHWGKSSPHGEGPPNMVFLQFQG